MLVRPHWPRAVELVDRAVPVPIAGITEENIEAVLAAGADMVAVIGAVVGAPNVRKAVQRLARRFESPKA